jgi:phosphatidylserine/phosphatidylglycerophosphate/cardiolipin synthase-like enzyme
LALACCACAAGEGAGTGSPARSDRSAGPLVITEVLAHARDRRRGDFIELANVADDEVELAGVTLQIGGGSAALAPIDKHPHVAQPGELAVVVDPDQDVDAAGYPPWVPLVTTAGTDLGELLAASPKIRVTVGGRLADSADASEPAAQDDVALERTPRGDFALSSLGASPGRRNAIHDDSALRWQFANPPYHAEDPVAPEMAKVIEGAQRTLDCAFFQVNHPLILDAFVHAAQRGVKVRFVTDTDYFQNPRYKAGYKRLLDAGIPVVEDRRSALMHSKFMVVDEDLVWTGSYNLIVPPHHAFDHVDNVLVMRSRRMADIHRRQFEQLFTGSFGPTKQDLGEHDAFVDGVRVEVYFAPADGLRQRVVDSTTAAQLSVHFVVFSFYDRAVGDALLADAARGVEVRGVVDATSVTGGKAQFGRLARASIDVRRPDNDRFHLFLHSKYLVVDSGGPWPMVITGSPNVSDSAYDENDEAMYIVHDAQVAGDYDQNYHSIYDPAIGPNKR